MCRRKPGPRCHQHSLRSFRAAERASTAAETRLREVAEGSAPESVVRAALARAEQTRDRLALAQRRLDATGTGMDALDGALADESLPPAERKRLSARRDEALWLREARKVQVNAMPPHVHGHDSPAATAAYDTLGETRESIAHIDTLIAARGGKPTAAMLRERSRLAAEAVGHDVTYRVTAAGRAADMNYVTAREAAALATAESELRDRIVYQSHLRAATAVDDAHPDADALVAERDAALAPMVDAHRPPPPDGEPTPEWVSERQQRREQRPRSEDGGFVPGWLMSVGKMRLNGREMREFTKRFTEEQDYTSQMGAQVNLEDIFS